MARFWRAYPEIPDSKIFSNRDAPSSAIAAVDHIIFDNFLAARQSTTASKPRTPSGICIELQHARRFADHAGAISSNLQDAITSARRLRGHPIYPDTITYWNALLREARQCRAELDESARASLDVMIVHLETALADRN